MNLADLTPELLPIKRDNVPDVPIEARKTHCDYGRDIVFDHEDQRWRFRNGELIGYIVYGGKPRRPIAMWGGNY